MKTTLKVLGLAAAGLLLSAPAHAVTYNFNNITNNDAGDAAIGEAQLFVDVTDDGGGQVRFTFRNEGPEASSIHAVYFMDEDGLMTNLVQIDGSSGVLFSEDANPPNLPGAGNSWSTAFSADADPPPSSNGVNPGESLDIVMQLGDYSFDDLIQAMNDGTVVVGIHVIAFDSGGSESFVTTAEPTSLLLLGLGLGGAALWGRKRA